MMSKNQEQKHKLWTSLMFQSQSKMLNTVTKPWVCFLTSQEKNLTCVILKSLNATHLETTLTFEVLLKALLTQEREVVSVT